jgi:hypothetical protein
MIHQQGKNIESQGGSPGAVVVIQVDYRAVSHAIGIVGVLLDYCPLDQRKLICGFHSISMSSSIAPTKFPTFLQS